MRETKAFKTRKEKMKLILGNKTTIMVGLGGQFLNSCLRRRT